MHPVAIVALAAVAMFAVERLVPGTRLPRVSGWAARVVALNALQVGIVFLGAATWDRWLPQWRLVDGAVLGPVGGVVVGYVATTFVFYWWHRARHEVPFLWRHLHQVHHSPARIEVAMSFYKHPLEILLNALIMSTLLVVVLGLPAATVAAIVALTGLAELFYHWNVRTPRWLGWLFQRPEMHRRHHERGHHRDNYSDLPVWDLLFGTFHNPERSPRKCGFARHGERRLVRLMLGAKP
jgi:sterol desaturase/sphingolipid hydroxylase (fatty acid hydroxylase superfamily)